MNKEQLKSIIKYLNLSYNSKNKQEMVNKILEPLKNYEMDSQENREICQDLALNTISKNKRKNLRLLAGTSMYSDMWTRDAFITSLGTIIVLFANNRYKIIKYVKNKELRKQMKRKKRVKTPVSKLKEIKDLLVANNYELFNLDEENIIAKKKG